ncbi:unnamed protein product, partial [Cladocopium goreaui]
QKQKAAAAKVEARLESMAEKPKAASCGTRPEAPLPPAAPVPVEKPAPAPTPVVVEEAMM